jgi:RimJ/RimL family protein N-acetyltransferase
MPGGHPRVVLRLVRAEDLEWLDHLVEEEESERAFASHGFRGRGSHARWFTADGCQGQENGVFVICADGELVGEVTYTRVAHGPAPASLVYSLGIGLRAAHRGRGIGGPAQRQLADRLFATTLVHRIEASTDTANTAECRALERAGFTREGVLRGAHFRDGSWRDLVMYSLLRTDA